MGRLRQQIDEELITINLKTELYAVRNDVLDYLVEHDVDDSVWTRLNAAEVLIDEWRDRFMDYLTTDDEYYNRIAHGILLPVRLVIDEMTRED